MTDDVIPEDGSPREAARAAARARRFFWLRAAAGAAIVVFLIYRVDVADFRAISVRGALLGSAGTVAAIVIAKWLSAVRLQALLLADTLSTWYLFRISMIGQFFSLFLPTAVGGDAVRAYALAAALEHPGEGVSGILLDRVLGFIALLGYLAVGVAITSRDVLAALGRPVYSGPDVILLLVAAAVGALLLLVLMAPGRRPASQRWKVEIARAGAMLRRHPEVWTRWLILSFLVQAAYILAWVALGVGLGIGVPVHYYLLAVPLVSIATMLPITLSGLGLREGAWALLLLPFGIPPANAVAFGLVYFVCLTVVGALGGIWFAIEGIHHRQPSAQ